MDAGNPVFCRSRKMDGEIVRGSGLGLDQVRIRRSGTYGSRVPGVFHTSIEFYCLLQPVASLMLLCFAAAGAVLWSLVGHCFNFAMEWSRQDCPGVYDSIVFCNSVLSNHCNAAAPELRR